MNKKIGLVELLKVSMLLTAQQKLIILDRLPTLNEKQVDALGIFLAMERRFNDAHKDEILANIRRMVLPLLDGEGAEKVYVGTGKAG